MVQYNSTANRVMVCIIELMEPDNVTGINKCQKDR